jgi:membrane protease YdiL (CAAX protease family)
MPGIALALLPLLILVAATLCAVLLSVGTLDLLGNVMPQAKLIGKLTLILLLLSIFPLRRRMQLSWNDLGFADFKLFFRQIGQGLLLGLVTLLPVIAFLYALDIQVWDSKRNWTVPSLSGKISLALFLAILIGIGEELLFRGLLLASLKRRMPTIAAMSISALYYAALHFLKSQTEVPYEHYSIANGLQLLGEAYSYWLNPQILPALLSLFIIGLFLATIRLKISNSLGLCIGCHAGWVWQIKICKDFFNVNPHSDYLYLISRYDGVIGPLVSAWLLAVLVPWWLMALRTHR